jgi:hypothetical protein
MAWRKRMTSKVHEAVERVKDAILPAPTYRTKTVKFKVRDQFLKSLTRGDVIVAGDGANAMGLVLGAEHEIEKVEGKIVTLKGGKRILAEFFRPEVRRRERIRTKVDFATQRTFLSSFAQARWADFRQNIDAMIKKGQSDVVKAERDLEHAQNKLRQLQDNVVRLEASKVSDNVWPTTLTNRLVSLIEGKLFSNFELIREGDFQVLIAYTGPMDSGINGEKKRAEYAVKVFPPKAPTRIVIENVTPGALPSDVPVNEGRTGICNVCFGGQEADIRAMLEDENWVRLLTLIRAFLEGNRSRN